MAATVRYDSEQSAGAVATAIGSISAANLIWWASANGQQVHVIEVPK